MTSKLLSLASKPPQDVDPARTWPHLPASLPHIPVTPLPTIPGQAALPLDRLPPTYPQAAQPFKMAQMSPLSEEDEISPFFRLLPSLCFHLES